MGSFNSALDPEMEHRRRLLAAARKGKAEAKEELEREYRVRVYSAAERATLYYAAIPPMRQRLSDRYLELKTDWAQTTESDPLE